eukprot:m.246887 g.246887  ORF g.246887 m.246887 type:complete len:426 (+) comp17478_c0_seq1:2983-4260(+)
MLSPKALLEAYETPIDVVVRKGHYGTSASQSLSEGEKLTIFFAREEDVCLAEDRFKRPVMVPLNTQARFKILEREPVRSPKGKKLPRDMDLKIMNLTTLVNNYKFPLFVRIVDEETDQELGAKSSLFAFTLQKLGKNRSMFASVEVEGHGTENTCIPVSLDVAFEPADIKRAKVRKHKKGIYDSMPEYEKLMDTTSVRGIGTLRLQIKKKPAPAPPLPPRVPVTRQLSLGASGRHSEGHYGFGDADLSNTRRQSSDGYELPRSAADPTYSVADSHPKQTPQRRSTMAAPKARSHSDRTMRTARTDSLQAGPVRHSSKGSSSAPATPRPTAAPKAASTTAPKVAPTFEPPPEDELAGMSVAGVCKMLAAMNLQRYEPAFQQEQISGLEFLSLDDDMLKDDMQISSRLHRMRILKAIERSKASASAC